jgi:hypothetical protein
MNGLLPWTQNTVTIKSKLLQKWMVNCHIFISVSKWVMASFLRHPFGETEGKTQGQQSHHSAHNTPMSFLSTITSQPQTDINEIQKCFCIPLMNTAAEWTETSAICVRLPVHWAFNGATPVTKII